MGPITPSPREGCRFSGLQVCGRVPWVAAAVAFLLLPAGGLGPVVLGADLSPVTASSAPGERITNSLGMVFVTLPGGAVRFSVWETRVSDYDAFLAATKRAHEKPAFEQTPEHPVVQVSWEDSKAFCSWLTDKERKEGRIGNGLSYRMPTVREWGIAAGDPDASPKATNAPAGPKDAYFWGLQWPAPKNSGNYGPGLGADDFANTAPVGSFAANGFGIFDLGGNVWEWCVDEGVNASSSRVLRGGSWKTDSRPNLLMAGRYSYPFKDDHFDGLGLRLVLAPVQATFVP